MLEAGTDAHSLIWLGMELYGQAEQCACKGSAKRSGSSFFKFILHFSVLFSCSSAQDEGVS